MYALHVFSIESDFVTPARRLPVTVSIAYTLAQINIVDNIRVRSITTSWGERPFVKSVSK